MKKKEGEVSNYINKKVYGLDLLEIQLRYELKFYKCSPIYIP